MERYLDAVIRIREMLQEETVQEPFRSYFVKAAQFVNHLAAFTETFASEEMASTEKLEALKRYNELLYGDLRTQYEKSYGNPAYAAEQLGAYGPVLSALYVELRGLTPLAYEKRYRLMAATLETLIQIYCMFEESYLNLDVLTGEKLLPTPTAVQDVFYSYCYDYSEDFTRQAMDASYDVTQVYAADIISQADFSNPDYLYRMGELITDNELKTAAYLAGLPQETIDTMAYTYYNGFKEGFAVMGKPYEKKSIVELVYELGFERVLKRAMEYFAADGFQVTIPRQQHHLVARRPSNNRGYYVSPNRQMDYDHSYDLALVMGEAIAARMLEERKEIFHAYGAVCSQYAGPAVMEVFGETAFEPKENPAALRFSAHQTEVYGRYRSDVLRLTHEYILEEERSFTIIAWPLPSIGRDYERIFDETIRINTMDQRIYRQIQQKLIDALDQAAYVEVCGKSSLPTDYVVQENQTRMKVVLHPLQNPEKETNFENCLADVNIPLGEVFTSPLLTGTEGILHVGSVYIDGIWFVDLKLRFEDGRVVDYSCANFTDQEAGRALIRKVIFAEKEHLPLGEFAIGTNTAAYAMAERYGIGAQLPILIAEKMGPHFAVGDTCYSFGEDMHLFNPDGKEIIAKDNECSLLRKVNPEKAYFACHCDITIPYKELDGITAVTGDGRRIPLMADGHFVLPGTEMLNEPLGSV